MTTRILQKINAWFCPKCGKLNAEGVICYNCGVHK